MRKTIIFLMMGLMLFTLVVGLEASGSERRIDRRFAPVPHSVQRHVYPDRDNQREYRYNHRDERRIWKEIHKNERRIAKLERKIQKLLRKQHHHSGYDRDNSYSRKIHRLKQEINRLQHRNFQLRQRLHR